MKRSSIIGWSILGGVAVFGFALYSYAAKQAQLLQNYSYRIVDLTFDTFDLQKIKGKISVMFGSQSDIEVTVEQFYLDFYFNNERVGYLEDVTPFIVPAKGSTVISLNYTLNPQLVLGNLGDILSYAFRKKDGAVSIRGYAKLKSGFVKATLPITFDTTLREILAD